MLLRHHPGRIARLVPRALLSLAVAGCAARTAPAPAALPGGTVAAGAGARPPARPRPYPVLETPAFARAVERGTRTSTGAPGSAYWQQWADYHIEAALDPAANRLTGHETVHYVNQSPDTLRRVAVYLRQNIYAPGAARTVPLPVTGGIVVGRVVADGRALAGDSSSEGVSASLASETGSAAPRADSSGYTVAGTVMWIRLPRPLPPRGGSVDLAFDWSFAPPPAPADGREGEDREVWFIGYWYPQLAVYDDVDGWVTDPYLGTGEMYMGYGDYDVRLTVPEGWLIGATGTLANGEEVLAPAVRARLAEARRTGSVVHVVDERDRGTTRATARGTGGRLTWHFTAHRTRDFAWATSARYLWDATRALVGAGKRDTVNIYSFYRPTPQARAWTGGARYTKNAIEFLSGYLWPYPYPQMTSVEGILTGGGMEYPMLTVIQSYADTLKLAGNLMHETGHMWFPMQVGSNEERVPWQDEGLTQFNSAQGTQAYYHTDREGPARAAYLALARAGREVPLSRPADLYGDVDAYFVQPYMKTTTVLVALRAILGDSTFLRAYREYGRRWQWKHPRPYDFFDTFDQVSGRDLSWFWRTWFYETWTLDQAIGGVTTAGDSTTIRIDDRALAPMPVLLEVTRADGSVQHLTIPVTAWLAGARTTTVRVPARPAVTRVVIDPRHLFPDSDTTNQSWSR